MFYQTLKAFIWRNTYANVNSMFDVSGENHDSNNASNKQKAMLVDILEKMGYQRTCDQIIDHALLYGELISFTAWKKNYEEYRRPIDFFKNLFSSDVQKLPLILDAIAKDLTISYVDEGHIMIGDLLHPCTGPRTHVPSTGCVQNFRIVKHIFYDPIERRYLLAGRVGPREKGEDIYDFNNMEN